MSEPRRRWGGPEAFIVAITGLGFLVGALASSGGDDVRGFVLLFPLAVAVAITAGVMALRALDSRRSQQGELVFAGLALLASLTTLGVALVFLLALR